MILLYRSKTDQIVSNYSLKLHLEYILEIIVIWKKSLILIKNKIKVLFLFNQQGLVATYYEES